MNSCEGRDFRTLSNYNELPKETREEIKDRVSLHSTVLVRKTFNGDWEQNGSGTFVKHNGEFGLLTAGHAAHRILGTGCFGLVVDTQEHLFQVKCSDADVLLDYGTRGTAPDIGFIRIPPEVAGTIEAGRHLFYNTSRNRADILRAKKDIHCGAWALYGAPAEMTTIENSTRTRGNVQIYRCITGFTSCTLESNVGPWDILKAEVVYSDPGESLPCSFKGVSGGGFWCVILNIDPKSGRICICSVLLEGVAFLESERVGDLREVVCHGPAGILDFLDRKTS